MKYLPKKYNPNKLTKNSWYYEDNINHRPVAGIDIYYDVEYSTGNHFKTVNIHIPYKMLIDTLQRQGLLPITPKGK